MQGNLKLLKELLASGQAVAFSGQVLKNPDHLPTENGVVYQTDVIPKSGHGQLLVGYDDTRGKADQPGAFLIQNSVGSDWPVPDGDGHIWFSYDTFLKTQFFAATAYPRDPSAPTGTALKAEGKAPAASITRAFQWAPDEKRTVFVLVHHFADAILIHSITLTSPAGKSMSSPVNQFLQSGYTHFQRHDGKGFAPGAWKVRIAGEDVAGAQVNYTGTVKIDKTAPLDHEPGPIDTSVAGPTGVAVTLE